VNFIKTDFFDVFKQKSIELWYRNFWRHKAAETSNLFTHYFTRHTAKQSDKT